MTLADRSVMELIAQAAPEGIEMLYDRYGRLAYSLALRIVGDATAAEDVVQESFLSIWRRSASYREDRGSVRTWVCSIVHNRAVDQLRGRTGRTRTELPIEAAPLVSGINDTWDAVVLELERESIKGALATLPAEQRETLELAYFAGYSQTEISRLMRVPLGTVKGRSRMALRKLRDTLESPTATRSPGS